MLYLKNINKKFKEKIIFNNFNYSFNDFGFYYLIGKSGSGKTTLLNLISCQDSIKTGSIIYPEYVKNIYNNIYYITQDNNLILNLSVIDNIKFILKINKIKRSLDQIKEVLNKLDISNLLEQKCSKLSGGEQKRLSIAIGLLIDTKILLCDEITSSLDEENKNNIIQILKDLSKEHLIIFSTHDLSSINDTDNIIDLNKKDNYKTVEEVLCTNIKYKKRNLNLSSLFLINFIVSKKKIINQIFTFLILSIVLFLITYTFCLKSLTQTNVICASIENNKIDSFTILNYKPSEEDKKLADIMPITQTGLSSSDFKDFNGQNLAISNAYILDDSLSLYDIILTDYSLDILKENKLIDFSSYKETLGYKLNLKNYTLNIKDIIYTDYKNSTELNQYNNRDYYYRYSYISSETYKKINGVTNLSSINLNGEEITINSSTRECADNEIYLTDEAIKNIFNTTSPSSFYNKEVSITFNELENNYIYEKKLYIKNFSMYYHYPALEMSENLYNELYDNLDGFIPTRAKEKYYYATNLNNKKNLKKLIDNILSNSGSVAYKNYYDVYETNMLIEDHTQGVSILAYIFLGLSFVFISYISYSNKNTNKTLYKSLKVHGIHEFSIYLVSLLEFIVPLILSFIASTIFVIFECIKFDKNDIYVDNVTSLNINVIILSFIFIIFLIMISNICSIILSDFIKKQEKN